MTSSSHGSTSDCTPTHQLRKVGLRVVHPPLNYECLLLETRKWIEECTGIFNTEKSYADYLMDGTVLCKLIQQFHPGLIKKINKHRNPFAWRENLTFFLEACVHLGLKNSQLFSLDDLLSFYSYKAKRVQDKEKSLRKVALAIYWLYHTLNQSKLLLESGDTEKCLDLLSSNSSKTCEYCSYHHSAKVQKITSIVTETQSSDIQFFPEVILFDNNQSSSGLVNSQANTDTDCFSRERQERDSCSELQLDKEQRRFSNQSNFDEDKCFGNVSKVEELDLITSYPREYLEEYNCSKGGSNYFSGISKHFCETQSCALPLGNTASKNISGIEQEEFPTKSSKNSFDSTTCLVLPFPSEVVTNSGVLEVCSVVTAAQTSLDTTILHNFAETSEVFDLEENKSISHSSKQEPLFIGDEFISKRSHCEKDFHSLDCLSLSNFQEEVIMEKCLSNPSQINGSTSDGILKDTEVLSELENFSQTTHSLLQPQSASSHDDSVSLDRRSLVTRNSSFLSSVMQVADKHATKTSRPMSAPTRSSSNIIMMSGSSSTLPSQLNASELKFLREKQRSQSNEKRRRRANIEEGARAALHYSAKRQSLKTMSLPRDHKSSLISLASSTSGGLEEKISDRKTSPVRDITTCTTPACCQDEIFLTDNLISRKVSITHDIKEAGTLQVDVLWNQTENVRKSDANTIADPSLLVGSASDESDVSPCDDQYDSDGFKKSCTDIGTDICVSFEASHSANSKQSKSSACLQTSNAVPLTGNDGKSRHRAASFSNKQIDSLLETLKSLSAHDEEVEELNILEGMLKSNTFKKAKQVHDYMHSLLSSGPDVPKPVVKRAISTTQLVRQHLHRLVKPSGEVNELRKLLRAPHVQAVLLCHDKVSTRDLYIPDIHFHRTAQDPVDIILSDSVYNFQAADHPIDTTLPLSRDVPSCRKEDAIIVFLERSNRPLGCTVYKQEDSVFFGKLLKGCDAESSDMLREGDELLEINGVPVVGRQTDEIVTMMSCDVQPGTVLALTIIPVHDDNIDLEYEPKYVKAHFNYNSKHDEDIPCKALGLNFQKGDILEISNHDDPEWWQARKVFDDGAESLPGLIPSRHLQQQREALIRSYPFASAMEKKTGVRSIFSKRKKKKIFYQNTSPSTVLGVGDEVPTYEDVIKLDSSSEIIRPIVLIGAPGVGRRTLIRKLLNSNTLRYLPVIQNTTRQLRPGEVNGQDYVFVTREEFECDIEQDRFLEYGELKGFYYGTAFSSIKKIMESHHVPVLELHPQALKKVRYCGLKPYIVFIASPRLERLHITRKLATDKVKKRLGSTLQHQDSTSQKFQTESDLQHLVQESYMIENQYGHYFDWIIVNDDFQVAADMLIEVAQRVQDEPQWVPKLWQLDTCNY